MKVCIVTANLGGIDNKHDHVKQVLPDGWTCDFFCHDDSNTTKRQMMAPRLQAKIYRTHAHYYHPDYDYYIWLDSAFKITSPDLVTWMVEQLGGNEACFFRHPERNTVKEEIDFVTNLLPTSPYLQERYKGDFYGPQYSEYKKDSRFVDDFLIASGAFIYRPTKRMCNALHDWYYHIARWNLQDQISLPYVLVSNKVKHGFFDAKQLDNPYIKHMGHAVKPIYTAQNEQKCGEVDVLFLANTNSLAISEMTQRAIDSLHASSTTTKFNAIVLESNGGAIAQKKGEIIHYLTVMPTGYVELHGCRYMADVSYVGQQVKVTESEKHIIIEMPHYMTSYRKQSGNTTALPPYKNARTIQLPFAFNYNKALNYGIGQCSADWVVSINNDVIFKPGWWEAAMQAAKEHNLDSVSPRCPIWYKHKDMKPGSVILGYRSGTEVAGWCIISKRATLNAIGGFDERFPFYGADDSYGMQLKAKGLRHAVVYDSVVEHLRSRSTGNLDTQALTKEAVDKMKECYPGWPLNGPLE